MDQVSRPLLIVLAATIALVVLWLVALRPKPVAVDNTPLAPTKVIPRAKDAAAAANAATAKGDAAANGDTDAAPALAAVADPARPAAKISPSRSSATTAGALSGDAAVLREIRADKVLVMLFWNPQAADDRATRGVVRELDRHKGKVAVHVIPIRRVGRYRSVTQDVKVVTSPTTIIMDRKQRTRVITGLTERAELSQAVGDALAGR